MIEADGGSARKARAIHRRDSTASTQRGHARRQRRHRLGPERA